MSTTTSIARKKSGNSATGAKKMTTNTSERSINQVQITQNYDIFKRLAGNRPIIPSHVLQLVNSMRDHDLFVPIIVNEKLQIIDGQHRVEARRELKLPVPYIVGRGMDLADVQKLNTTAKHWSSDDYARSFIEQGNVHYMTYMEFRTTWDLPHEASVMMLAGRGAKAMRKAFVTGEFRVTDLEGARKMASILHSRIKPQWLRGWKDTQFLRALYIANMRIGWDMDRFVAGVEANRSMLDIYRSVDQYLLMIEEIFNSTPGRKVPIRYGKAPTGAAVHGNAWAQKHPDGERSPADLSDAKRKSMHRKYGSMADGVASVLASGKAMGVKDIAVKVLGKAKPEQEEINSISNACSVLVKDGLVTRVSRGVYQLVAASGGKKYKGTAATSNARAQNAKAVAAKRRGVKVIKKNQAAKK